MKQGKHLWKYVFGFASVAAIFAATLVVFTTPNWQKISAETSQGTFLLKTYDVGLDNAPAGELVTLSGTLYANSLTDKTLRVLPDDCLKSLTVNGREAPLSGFTEDQLCNVEYGFSFDLSGYLTPGANTITAEAENLAGGVKLGIEAAPEATNHKIALLLLFVSLGTAVASLGWGVLRGPHARAALIIAFALGISYLGYTRWYERSHDVHGHVPHIEAIANENRLPKPEECWECHQQPLYYLAAAGGQKALIALTGGHPLAFFFLLQVFSLSLFGVFLIFGLKLLERFPPLTLYLFALWPSGILHSVRIGNDIPLYATLAAFLFFLDRYWRKQTWQAWTICLALGLVATFIKISGIVAIGALGLIFLYKNLKHLREFELNYWLALMCLGLIGAIFVLPIVLRPGSASIHRPGESMRVGNTLANFIYIDLDTFVNRPDISTFEDSGGRQHLPNILLKTAILGEFGIDEPLHRNVAIALSALLLILISAGIAGALGFSKQDWHLGAPALLLSALLLAALLYFRVTIPYSSNQDFRYMYPGVLGAVFTVGIILKNSELWSWTARQAIKGLILTWITLSVAFILSPLFTGGY